MITATMQYTTLEIHISGTGRDLAADLAAFKQAVDEADREFIPGRGAWLLKHPEKYVHLPYVAAAVRIRQSQPALF